MKRRTKIVATICGLPVWTNEIIRNCILEGVDIFRISSSFRPIEEDERIFNSIREISHSLGLTVEILHDVNQGVKVRLLTSNPVHVIKNDVIDLGLTAKSEHLLRVDWPELTSLAELEQIIHIGDGEIAMKIIEIHTESLRCLIINTGTIKSKKAISIAGINQINKPINTQNKDDILLSARLGFDYVALSFVKSEKDIHEYKALLMQHNTKNHPRVIAKIETQEALDNLDSILAVADGLMIARGDLALQTNYAQLGVFQKKILNKCSLAKKISIVATQMIESIIERHIPARAEIIDITNAVFQNSSAVMLGPETCMNPDPIRAIKAVREIIEFSEYEI